MLAINRFKRMFTGGSRLHGDNMFETYYGSIVRDNQDGGPSAQEARRDFENIRRSLSRISVF